MTKEPTGPNVPVPNGRGKTSLGPGLAKEYSAGVLFSPFHYFITRDDLFFSGPLRGRRPFDFPTAFGLK